jgi:hypothetical protein
VIEPQEGGRREGCHAQRIGQGKPEPGHAVSHGARHIEVGARERPVRSRQLSALPIDRSTVQIEAGEIRARHRHGVGYEHHVIHALGRNGDAQSRVADVVPVDDQSAPRAAAVEPCSHRPGVPAGEGRHGVEEMREASQTVATCFHDGGVIACRMACAHEDACGSQARDGFHAVALGCERHEGAAFLERRQDGDVLVLHGAHVVRIVDTLALGVDEWPFHMDAEDAGNACGESLTHGLHRLDHALPGVGNEGWQQTHSAVGPMGFGDGPQSLGGAHVIEEYPATAIHLYVNKARSKEAFDPLLLDPGPDVPLVRKADNATVPDDNGASFEDVIAVEDAGSHEGKGHHTVSVTLRRRGGLSGLRPRASAMAFTRG